jgi:hypothetical protein
METLPEIDTENLADVLRALLVIEDGRDLERLLKRIKLDTLARTADDRTALLNAIASATARCWAKRSRTDCCGD